METEDQIPHASTTLVVCRGAGQRDIREFKHYLIEGEQLKPSTVNRKLASIRSFVKWAKMEDEIEDLPRFPQSM